MINIFSDENRRRINKAIAMSAGLAVIYSGLSGCASKPAPIPTVVVNTKPTVQAPDSDPLALGDVHWKVYNRDGLEKLVADAKANNQDLVVFVLDEDGFKTLSSNMVDILAFVKQQNAKILFYKNAYATPDQASSSSSSSAASSVSQ